MKTTIEVVKTGMVLMIVGLFAVPAIDGEQMTLCASIGFWIALALVVVKTGYLIYDFREQERLHDLEGDNVNQYWYLSTIKTKKNDNLR